MYFEMRLSILFVCLGSKEVAARGGGSRTRPKLPPVKCSREVVVAVCGRSMVLMGDLNICMDEL